MLSYQRVFENVMYQFVDESSLVELPITTCLSPKWEIPYVTTAVSIRTCFNFWMILGGISKGNLRIYPLVINTALENNHS